MSNNIINQNQAILKPSFLENYLCKPFIRPCQLYSTHLLSFRVLAIISITLLIISQFSPNLYLNPTYLILTPLIYMLFSTLNLSLILSHYPLNITYHQPNQHSTLLSITTRRPLCIKI